MTWLVKISGSDDLRARLQAVSKALGGRRISTIVLTCVREHLPYLEARYGQANKDTP